MNTITCPNCGVVTANSQCPNCGRILYQPQPQYQQSQQIYSNINGQTQYNNYQQQQQYNNSQQIQTQYYQHNNLQQSQYNQRPKVNNIAMPKKSVLSKFLNGVLVFLGLCIIFSVLIKINIDKEDSESTTTESYSYNDDYTTESTSEHTATTEAITEAITEEVANINIPVASDFSDMNIRDICNDKDLYIGLSYAKISPTLTIDYGNIQEDITEGKQVLFAYFDVYNSGSKVENITAYDFTCYVDGVAVTPVDTYYYYSEDGISSRFSDDIDSGTCKMLITDFEIPFEWSEIKLYYNSKCAWILNQNDVSTEPFEFNSMYDIDYPQGNTEVGDIIYSDKYEIAFDGSEYYTQPYSNNKYIIFKFTVNNTSNSVLDYSLVGYNMRCYVNNYTLESGAYGIDEKIDDHINVYSSDVENIPSGMSAKVYVAFQVYEEYSSYRMIYNTGYIDDEILADIFVNN